MPLSADGPFFGSSVRMPISMPTLTTPRTLPVSSAIWTSCGRASGLMPIALAVTAEATRDLRLTTLMLGNDFRHPLFLAKQAATLDLLSDGRLELGLGAGWKTTDYDQSGLALDPPGVRIARLAESVEILKRCFAEGSFDFDGEHYTVRGHDGQPTCIQLPHPPFLLGGGGRKMLSLAAQEAEIVGLNANMAAGVIDQKVVRGHAGTVYDLCHNGIDNGFLHHNAA